MILILNKLSKNTSSVLQTEIYLPLESSRILLLCWGGRLVPAPQHQLTLNANKKKYSISNKKVIIKSCPGIKVLPLFLSAAPFTGCHNGSSSSFSPTLCMFSFTTSMNPLWGLLPPFCLNSSILHILSALSLPIDTSSHLVGVQPQIQLTLSLLVLLWNLSYLHT